MQAILYVGHGSRVREGSNELLAFVEKAKQNLRHIPIQETCFIELAAPDIETGIATCIGQGATKIAVIPVLLLAAGHAKFDIPNEIKKAQHRYPGVHFSYGKVLGVEPVIIQLLKSRLEENGLKKIFSPPNYEEREPVTVLLIGRGSSDPGANSDLAKIARLLWEVAPVRHIETCYLAATRPSLVEGLERTAKEPFQHVYVLPYLLFTGVLMKEIQQKLDWLSEKTAKQYTLCPYLGFDERLVQLLITRVQQLLDAPLPSVSELSK